MDMSEACIDFKGMRVLVSGASSGIGRAIAVELSRRGAGLILVGRDRKRLEETAAMAGTAERHLLSLDLQNTAEVFPAVREFAASVGRIYGLCHAAGIVETLPLTAGKAEHVRRLMDVNLISGLELARAVSRRDIMEPDGGAMLFISSIYSRVGAPGQIGYCASKGALNAAVRAMALELARRKIRVNTLSPGVVHTAMTAKAFSVLSESQVKAMTDAHPLGIGTPEDVAWVAAFLLAPQNRWMTGIDLALDGGFTAQ
ncbi:MAG: SDR family oxidoreductase [Desulfobacterales bacterium]|jgi:NAD(P)-dependent dehydrogenase (short-subunit alcohol dehydrogenase family)|nr:SDR family oxidoreductase [Desulfobacterales bacterium]